MSKTKSTAKLVITSVILSLIVLAIFTLVFLKYIVPVYNITEKQVYDVLVKLFPILVGLALIQIGIITGKQNEEDFKDQIDKLPPNSYSNSISSSTNDDPDNISLGAASLKIEKTAVDNTEPIIKEVPVEVVKEVVKEVPIEVVKEVPVEVIKQVVKEVPVEILRDVTKEVEIPIEVIKEVPIEVLKEVPVEVLKEVPVEVIKPIEVVKEPPVEVVKEVEVPVEIIKEVPVETIKEVEVPVEVIKEVPVEIIKEVPVEILRDVPVEVIKEVIKEVPVEVIKEVPQEIIKEVIKEVPVEVLREIPVEVVKEVEKEVYVEPKEEILDLNSFLDKEIAFARENFTDLTVVAIRKSNEITADKLNLTLKEYSFIFEQDDVFILVFCFANKTEVDEIIKSQEFNLGPINYSSAALNDKSTPESLINEVKALV